MHARTSHRHQRPANVSWKDHGDRSLTQIVDAGIAAALVLAPLFMGGRGAVGQVAYVALPGIALIAWFARQAVHSQARWRWSGVEWLLASGLLLVVAQLVSWPNSLLAGLSPETGHLLPLWTAGSGEAGHLGTWSTWSLTPESTRHGLLVYVAYVMFFLLLVQRIRHSEDVSRLLAVLAIATVGMATVGLVQFLVGTEKFLGVYEHPSRSASLVARGTFQNENHFAHFLCVGLGPLIWWLQKSLAKDSGSRESSRAGSNPRDRQSGRVSPRFSGQTLMIAGGVVLVVLAGLLTFSRGGVLMLGLTLAIVVGLMTWQGELDRRVAILLAAGSVINLLAMLVFGLDSLSLQLGSMAQAQSWRELLAGRVDLWRAIIAGIQHFPWTGTGVGSHREVHPIYLSQKYEVEYTHGESGYLPLLLETGVVGLGLLMCGIGMVCWWSARVVTAARARSQTSSSGKSRRRELSYVCAIIPAIVVSLLHSVVDFVWYIPACLLPVIAQMACVCRLDQMLAGRTVSPTEGTGEGSEEVARSMVLPRGAWLSGVTALGVLTVILIGHSWGPARAALDWDCYLKLADAGRGEKPLPPLQEAERQAGMAQHLERILASDPRDARAHLRLAGVYLKQFELRQQTAENAMSLPQIRDAALASQFPSRQAQEAWLTVALEDSRILLNKALEHSHRAVALCPLQGLAYTYLAELSFLESPRFEWKRSYIDQAVRVRPYHGQVLYLRGREAALANDLELAFRYWKEAFHRDPEMRAVIVDSLVDQIPVEFFVTVFEPDADGLATLFQRFRTQGREEQTRQVAQWLIPAMEKSLPGRPPGETANGWHLIHEAYLALGDQTRALSCQERAVAALPTDAFHRRQLAQLYVRLQRPTEAVPHLEWCVRRQPEDQTLAEELAAAKLLARTARPSVVAGRPEARH